MKFKKHGGLYEVIRNPINYDIHPDKYYIVVGPVTRVVKGSILMKALPRSPLKPSNGRMSRLSDYDEARSPLKESNGRVSRLASYSDCRAALFCN
jgi:hypothetical protein